MFYRIVQLLLFSVFICQVTFAQKSKITKAVCPPGEHWVKAHIQSSYLRSDGTAVSGSYHKAHCQKNPPAYAIWNERLKSGVPQEWEIKNEKAKVWSEVEKEKVLESLSLLPDILLLKSVKSIYRLKNSELLSENPAAGFKNQIALYDKAFNSKYNLTQVLAHEFAHVLFNELPNLDRLSYVKEAEWVSKEVTPGRLFLIPKRKLYVEEDGRHSPDEDFANNVEYFLFYPKKLMETSPQVFDWINQKYGDKLKLRGVK